MKFSDRLKDLRNEKNVTQADVARYTGLSSGCIGMLETNKREPTGNTLTILADYFGCSVDYLLGREDDFGNISVTTNSDLTAEEKVMLELFNQLPNVRRRTIIDTMRFMVDSNKSSATQNKISNVKK